MSGEGEQKPRGRPEYKVYRSKRGLLSRFRRSEPVPLEKEPASEPPPPAPPPEAPPPEPEVEAPEPSEPPAPEPEAPVAEEPVEEEPVESEPVAEEPVEEEPVEEEPVAEEPVAEEPVAEEPVVAQSTKAPPRKEPTRKEPPRKEPPTYTRYKSGRGLRGMSDRLRTQPGRVGAPKKPKPKPGRVRTGDGRPWWKWALIGAGVWILISIAAFGISAQIQKSKLPDTGDSLSGGINMITQPSTILVIGGDKRGDLHSGDESATSNRPLADTVMLMRAGGGAFRKLSIPRDTIVPIEGFGEEKINSAFALGDAGEDGNVELLTQTVEDFLDIEINHVIVVSFDGFVDFIDALGGIKIDLTKRVCGVLAGGRKNGGQSIRLGRGEHTINGDQALLLSRIRRNSCNPAENDVDRAKRQQLMLAGIKNRLTDPLRLPYNFIKGPIIGWSAPKAIVSDMGAFTMPQLAFAAMIGGGGDKDTQVLEPDGSSGGGLIVSEEERRQKVNKFLDG